MKETTFLKPPVLKIPKSGGACLAIRQLFIIFALAGQSLFSPRGGRGDRQNIKAFLSLKLRVKTTYLINKKKAAVALMAMATLLFGSLPARSALSERYSESSVLSEGKWAKIRVATSGMQYVSNSQLSSMGFSDPSKVNVYGFGGRQISETLNPEQPDDLPLLPCVRTSNGIIFFGVDHIDWSSSGKSTLYSHTMQSYSENSYYFLSDRETETFSLPSVDLKNTADAEEVSSFFERLVHEKDLYAPAATGRSLFGEDFRSGSQQSFNFALPGNVSGNASVLVAVGSKTTGAKGTFTFASNGKVSNNTLSVNAITSVDQFMRASSSRFDVTGCGDNLQLKISYATSGVLVFSRLDYIEVEYERALTMGNDELYFYMDESVDVAANLSGITSETEIWDVTSRHAPVKVEFNREGNSARFRIPAGYREYIAFNPSKVAKAPTFVENVQNQDIHSLPVPDMLIVTPAEFSAAAERVAQLHRNVDGMTVHVLTPEMIYNEFSSGTPDLSAFRKALKMWYDRGLDESESADSKMKYCLIFSRPTFDLKGVTEEVKNSGWPHIPIWQSTAGTTENTSYSTDDFIGMLEDYSSSATIGSNKINIAVGRFPVRTVEEANSAAEKLENYVLNPERASWRNNVMIVADDQDSGVHLEQAETMYGNMKDNGKGDTFQYERLYLDNFVLTSTSVGAQYPEAQARFLSKIEEGQALLAYIGHANTVSWTHEKLLTWKEITSFSNTRLPVLYAATCEFARWDEHDYSGAEVMWAFPKSGIIATICPSRAVFISQNGPLSAQFGKQVFGTYSDGKPLRLGDVHVNAKNGMTNGDDNKLRYVLMGDPAMRMPIPEYNVIAEEIAGKDISEISEENPDLPVIEARSTPLVKGRVADHEGNIIPDFNGLVYIKLYDSMEVVETLGNGSEGKKVIYNDHKTKLYEGVTRVENGKWEVKINMPYEIRNLYNPGRMTFYAVADDGREANGATEKYMVYGFDKDAPEDNKGPQITLFTINNEDFEDGGVTTSTPVVYAAFTDESGINVSEAGIGHQLQLTLDGSKIFTDITDYYSPDPNDSNAGSIIYQLPELAPGKHELKLSVWDNANNSTYASLNFNVAVNKKPDIFSINAIYAPDKSGLDFVISSDRPLSKLTCKVEVFDLSGIRVWSTTKDERTAQDSSLRIKWNYTTNSGQRLNRGIYVCKVTVESPEGSTTSKGKKIVVPAF